MGKKRASRINVYQWRALISGILAILLFSGMTMAATPVTATLKVTPSPSVRAGGSLTFQATVYNDPTFLSEYAGIGMKPGYGMRVWVTRHDFSWVSDKLDLNYPAQGQQVNLNFAQPFVVPANAQAGQTYDFYLVFGIWYPISNKASSKVITVIPLQQMKIDPHRKTMPSR